jgi:hypothetical protein
MRMAKPTFRKKIRQMIQRTLPALIADWIIAVNRHQSFKKRFWKEQSYYWKKLYGKTRTTEILGGPFIGLKYFNRVAWGPLMPKWLGSYEWELHDTIRKINQNHYNTIFDIGCAEGYYAVGLAKRNPATAVYAYDCDPFARKLCAELKAINRTENLSIFSHCTYEEIINKGKGRVLLLCDIEGDEYRLLDPPKCSALRKMDILVESHPFQDKTEADVAKILNDRFKETHYIQIIIPRSPELSKHKNPAHLSADELSACLNEHRQWNTPWLWMQATSAQLSPGKISAI